MKQIERLVTVALLAVGCTTASAMTFPTILSAQSLNPLGIGNGVIKSTRVGGSDVRSLDSVKRPLPAKIEYLEPRFGRDQVPTTTSARGHWPHPYCGIVYCPPPPWCIVCPWPWPFPDPCCLPHGVSAKSHETGAQKVAKAIPDASRAEVTPDVLAGGIRSVPAVEFRDAILRISEPHLEQPGPWRRSGRR